jgi:hypothetical protein
MHWNLCSGLTDILSWWETTNYFWLGAVYLDVLQNSLSNAMVYLSKSWKSKSRKSREDQKDRKSSMLKAHVVRIFVIARLIRFSCCLAIGASFANCHGCFDHNFWHQSLSWVIRMWPCLHRMERWVVKIRVIDYGWGVQWTLQVDKWDVKYCDNKLSMVRYKCFIN